MSAYRSQNYSCSTRLSMKRHSEVVNLITVEADGQAGTIQKITNLPNNNGLLINVVQGLRALFAKGKDLDQIVKVFTDMMEAVIRFGFEIKKSLKPNELLTTEPGTVSPPAMIVMPTESAA